MDVIWWHYLFPQAWFHSEIQVLNPKFGVWDWSDSLFKATIQLKKMSQSWDHLTEEIPMQCLPWLFRKSFPTFWELGSRSGNRFLCDPSHCHCPHGESLVMPEFLFLVLLLLSGWNHWPVRDLSEEINMLISLGRSPQLLPLCLCASWDAAFPGSSGRMVFPLYLDGISFKPFHY